MIFEVSGGFQDSATQLLSKATEVAGKNKVKLAAEDWSWSAMEWLLFHAQVLLFKINKMTALAVLNGHTCMHARTHACTACMHACMRACMHTHTLQVLAAATPRLTSMAS